MVTLFETALLCALFFAFCFLGTGTDEKNLKSFRTYPNEVQNRIKAVPEYRGKFKEIGKTAIFLSNTLLFIVVMLVFGFFIRQKDFWHNFLCLSVMGQGLNLFDLLIIDLLWWRNTKRIRLTRIPEKEPYQDPKKHIGSFRRGVIMYIIVALIDGALLTLI